MARIDCRVAILCFDVLHDQTFGDLQLQSGRRMRVDTDCLLDLGDEAAIAQLQR